MATAAFLALALHAYQPAIQPVRTSPTIRRWRVSTSLVDN